MIEIDRFFDIETADWTKFAVGGVITAGTEEYFWTTNESEFFWQLVSPGRGTVWSWNGGKFDMLWLLDMARKLHSTSKIDLTCKISTAGPRITSVQCNGVTFRDSVAICPFSLQKAASIAGITMSKDTGVSCICGEDCGGYCGVTPELDGMISTERDAFIEYLRLDNLAGLRIMEAIIAEAERCDYTLTGTIGGSSFKTAKQTLGLESANWRSGSEYSLARQAYFGGRVEVFQPTAEKGFSYDINSAYPAALVSTPLPCGERIECTREKARRAYLRGREGLYMARVVVPEMFVPPLPKRLQSGRVAFPVGEFSGIWPATELREAESLGCDVDITGGLVWAEARPIFSEYMAKVWKHRDENRDNKGLNLWHKFFANSLTGKLAERPDKERIVMFPPAQDIKWCPGGKCKPQCSSPDAARSCGQSACCDKKHRGGCGAWRMLDLDATLYTAPFWRISECAHVHWAAYLTATARIQLGRQLRADGQGGLSSLYCDTDSVYATAPRYEDVETPEEVAARGEKTLGKWGYDGPIEDWLAVAPKLYRYTNSDTGKQAIKAKGLSGIDREQFDAFVRGEKVEMSRGVKSFKSACKDKSGSLFVRKHLVRSNRSDGIHYGSRVLRKDGKTYPQTMAELLRWEMDSMKGTNNG